MKKIAFFLGIMLTCIAVGCAGRYFLVSERVSRAASKAEAFNAVYLDGELYVERSGAYATNKMLVMVNELDDFSEYNPLNDQRLETPFLYWGEAGENTTVCWSDYCNGWLYTEGKNLFYCNLKGEDRRKLWTCEYSERVNIVSIENLQSEKGRWIILRPGYVGSIAVFYNLIAYDLENGEVYEIHDFPGAGCTVLGMDDQYVYVAAINPEGVDNTIYKLDTKNRWESIEVCTVPYLPYDFTFRNGELYYAESDNLYLLNLKDSECRQLLLDSTDGFGKIADVKLENDAIYFCSRQETQIELYSYDSQKDEAVKLHSWDVENEIDPSRLVMSDSWAFIVCYNCILSAYME